MALDALIDEGQYSSLPEALKAEYRLKDDGAGYLLQVNEIQGIALEDVTGLRGALESERKSVTDLKRKLKSFDGLDPRKARDAIRKVDEFAKIDPEKELEAKIKEHEAQLIERHNETLQIANKRADGYLSQLESIMIDNEALKAIQTAGGNAKLLLPHVRNQIRMKEDEQGRLTAEVFNPRTGSPRAGDNQGNPLTIPQLIDEIKADKDYAVAFAGSGQTGSGAVSGSTGTPKRPTGATTQKGVTYISASDQDAINRNWQGIAEGKVIVQSE